LGKPPGGVFWQQISIKPFVGVCVVACYSTNIKKKAKNTPLGKPPARVFSFQIKANA
jgi:hypothetical protein